ncbi:hypothetical protein LGM14_27870, partial [Burkholderia multivorans]|nr:hypothetical protein [Burkholderia multivorans]
STGGHRLAGANPWIGTTICTGNSPKADHELRLKPDHPMGSGHGHKDIDACELIHERLADSIPTLSTAYLET